MGDRTYTTITLSGVVNEEDVDELVEAVNADWLTCDDGPELNDNALMREHLEWMMYNPEANYGELEETQSACQRLGVSYLKVWAEGGGYGPGMEIYNAVTGVTVTCGAIEGEPALTLSDIKKIGDAEAAIGYLEAFNNFRENYGPFEIKPLEDAA
jgi:hypothetical protein